MPQIHKTKKLPFSAVQMFDLVADVERYPEFLPWCAAAKLVKRDEQEIIGTLTAEKGGFKKSFTTRNRYHYPDWMDIALVNGPFKHLSGRWDFIEQPNGGCEVKYQMRFEVPFLLVPILGGLMDYMANTMVDAFAERAKKIYGTH
ncbi:type II toxin-antitoxin system RatA family toxin [Suttonella ornithocola]|uniref:Ribosome association toxin RatA n=1 Tax=Suttonella ornithocola TaxID=279832 RepID=A0A380MYS4_9GAMM|nr:type II toxin-antitoxin system RatA family toxin [Suttonella ornithocola]SUO97699.1 Ribosome association toxin RatA [Suttonella ornithocola]